ncbi:methylmalonyl-CoA mutase, partial [Streptomyces lasiicapitis]
AGVGPRGGARGRAPPPRASTASNFCVGAAPPPAHDPVSVDATSVADAFKASGARVACLCSSDALYADEAAAVAAALKSAGAERVFLAGRPGEYGNDVDAYVFAGCDAVAVLSSTLDLMGVAP